eukprot:5002484-Pyramimonas_sp.AAC.1
MGVKKDGRRAPASVWTPGKTWAPENRSATPRQMGARKLLGAQKLIGTRNKWASPKKGAEGADVGVEKRKGNGMEWADPKGKCTAPKRSHLRQPLWLNNVAATKATTRIQTTSTTCLPRLPSHESSNLWPPPKRP